MTVNPVEPVKVVEADKARPYKAIAAAVLAALTAVLTQYADDLPLWALILIAALVAGLTTYSVPNPLTLKKDSGWNLARGEGGYSGLINALVAIVVLIVLVWLVVFLVRSLSGA